MTKSDGGAAFPFGEKRFDGGNHYLGKQYDPGMSLRDWYIGQSIGAVIIACKDDTREKGETHEQMFARKAAAVADALLSARDEG